MFIFVFPFTFQCLRVLLQSQANSAKEKTVSRCVFVLLYTRFYVVYVSHTGGLIHDCDLGISWNHLMCVCGGGGVGGV